MRKTLYAVIITSALMICVPTNPISAKAVETDTHVTDVPIVETSGLIFSYDLSISGGSKKIYISGMTYSCEEMELIGLKNIKRVILSASCKRNWSRRKRPRSTGKIDVKA